MKLTKTELHKLYWDKGLSQTDISKIYGCARSTVSNYFKRYNIPLRSRSEAISGERNPHYNKPMSKETRHKMSESRKGKYCGVNNPMYGRESAFKGKHHSDEAKAKISKAHKGRIVSEESRLKLSQSRKERFKGENSPKWKGGISLKPTYSSEWAKNNPESRLRTAQKTINRYKKEFGFTAGKEIRAAKIAWSTIVKARDDHTCQKCGSKKRLQSHHITPIAADISKSLDIDNGVTLCYECHINGFHHEYGRFNCSSSDFYSWFYGG